MPSPERRDLLRHLDDEAGHRVGPDASARAIAQALFVDGAGVFDVDRGVLAPRAYVDLGHLGGALLPEVRAEIERLVRVTGLDLVAAPVLAAPGIADTLGGLAVGFAIDGGGALSGDDATNHATTVPGLYAAGSAAHAYHGAQRLPGHRLLEALAGGELAARAMAAYCAGVTATTAAHATLEAAEREAKAAYESILHREGEPEARNLRASLGEVLDAVSGLAASPPSLAELEARIDAIATRAAACAGDDDARRANRGAPEVRRLSAAVLLARAVIATARARAEAEPARGDGARVVVRLADGAFRVTCERRPASDPPADQAPSTESAP